MDGHLPQAAGTLSLGASMGPMARTVDDVGLMLAAMNGGTEQEAAPDLRALRAAYYLDDSVAPVTLETARAVLIAADALVTAGLEVHHETPPGIAEGQRLWVELFSNTSAEHLREFYRGREDQAGPLVSNIISRARHDDSFEGRITVAERLARAVVERERLGGKLLQWMSTRELILAPVGAVPAFAHGASQVEINGQSISVFRAFSYSQTFNVYGLPALSVPVAKSEAGLPIGVQIIGRFNQEQTVLAAAKVIEKAVA